MLWDYTSETLFNSTNSAIYLQLRDIDHSVGYVGLFFNTKQLQSRDTWAVSQTAYYLNYLLSLLTRHTSEYALCSVEHNLEIHQNAYIHSYENNAHSGESVLHNPYYIMLFPKKPVVDFFYQRGENSTILHTVALTNQLTFWRSVCFLLSQCKKQATCKTICPC